MANPYISSDSTQPHVDVGRSSFDGAQSEAPQHGHNSSMQHGVDPNPDLALHYSHEHPAQHKHHAASALAHRHDNVMYTSDTTAKGTDLLDKPPQDYTTHILRAGDKDNTMINDAEKGGITPTRISSDDSGSDSSRRRRFSSARMLRKYKLLIHIFIWLVFTGWWIAGLILHRHDLGWLIPFLLYLAITLRIVFLYVPSSIVFRPMQITWNNTIVRVYDMVPIKLHKPLAAAGTVAVILVGTFASKEAEDNTRGNRAISLVGLVVMILLLYGTSRNRSRIQWHTVIGGMLAQFVIALFVLRTKAGYDIFNFISTLARSLLGFANQGVVFLTDDTVPDLHWFLTGVVPPIIFFISLVQVLYYTGVLQWCVVKFATFFFWSLRVSGAEAVVAAATPFVGQGESAMLVRPFVPHMTLAEIHQVMACGFATISGSVLVAYIGLGLNPQALVSSCIMSIPASLAVSKLRYPETEETITSGRVVVPDDDENRAANALHAFANGAWLGIKVAGMIIATLLCIIALVGLVNGLLSWWGHYLDIPNLTLQQILGYICYPVAFLLGVPRQDLFLVGELIGTKVIINEFAAFLALSKDAAYANLAPRSKLIATYALCGFGNLGSLGTQIGVLSQIAPGRAGDVSRVALSALFCGVISTLSSAAVAGLVVTDEFGISS